MGIAGRKIKLFADGADLNEIRKFHEMGVIAGFTSNPFFLKRYGVTNYERFIRQAVEMFPDLSMSFEVLSDDLTTMEHEAVKIAGWAENCHIKIPITNTKGESTSRIIKSLSQKGENSTSQSSSPSTRSGSPWARCPEMSAATSRSSPAELPTRAWILCP